MPLVQMTWEQVAATALYVGWTEAEAVTATAITGNESARYPRIIQQGQPYATTGWGLWQITPGNSAPQFGIDYQLLDPINNGRAAHWKYVQAGGWSPWAADFPTIIQQYIPAAEAGVAAAAHLTPAQLRKLIREVNLGGVGQGLAASSASDWSPLVRMAADKAAHTAARHHAAARAVRELRPRFRPPRVVIPAPGRVLWTPGQPLDAS